jgi:cytochrome c biogenesis protein CcmG, thiol:disulfide interchange protein DsbE
MDRAAILGLVRDWGLALLAAVVLFVGWSWLFGGGPLSSGEAPDFTLPDVRTGEDVTLSELEGPVVLNFWATWCGPCKAELPDLVAWSQAHPEVPFVGVSIDHAMPSGRLARWVETREIPYTIVHDRSHTVADAWGVTSYPTTFVLSADGHVAGSEVGMVDQDELDALLAQARAHTH